ncbi:unnamed protein product [Meganyctiphanes norvegica]|uniref:Uncharacterized protein n=1 Tax=Meganyctiphanes norvegica TaxID=48144 RepID=A0AAV2QS38_MEGNR
MTGGMEYDLLLEEDLSNGTYRELEEQEMIEENTHAINIATAYLLLTIFTFFTMLVTVVLIMHYCERKRLGFSRELLILPKGPVPSYMTVMTTDDVGLPQCHGHYQFHPILTQPPTGLRGLWSPKNVLYSCGKSMRPFEQRSLQHSYGSVGQDSASCQMCGHGETTEHKHQCKQSFNKDSVNHE